MKTLSETLERGNNNFDLIRLFLAIAVMLGHSYSVQAGPTESMIAFTHRESFGSLAVYGFFMISGMLVSASFAHHSSVWRFMALRGMRIWPGAAACALFIAFFVGPIFSNAALEAYFTSPQTFHWVVHNVTLIGHVGGPLPGLFETNHLRGLVNATVWTLPIELKCYVLVLLFGLAGGIGSKPRTLIFVTVALGIFAAIASHQSSHLPLGNFFLLPIAYSFYPVPFFLLGMFLYAYRDHVWLSWLPAAILVVAYVLTRFTLASTLLLYPAFAYGLLWLASCQSLRRFAPRHDYSYGIYLYGFVIQQIVASFLPSLNNYIAFFLALPVTIGLAAISWHLVEHPCLEALRSRAAAKRAGISLATGAEHS